MGFYSNCFIMTRINLNHALTFFFAFRYVRVDFKLFMSVLLASIGSPLMEFLNGFLMTFARYGLN